MAKLKQIKFGKSLNQIAKTIVNGKGVIQVTNTKDYANSLTEDNDYSYDIDVNVDGTTIVKNVDKLAVGIVPAEKVSVAASAGLTATEAQSAFAELKGKIDEVGGAAKSYTIVKTTEGLATNVKEQYRLQDEKNTPVGEPINIYKDSSLMSVALNGQVLNFTYILADGKESTVGVDVSNFLAEEEFANGLAVNNHVVSVKVDENSEKFLTVSADGVKLSGVKNAIDAAVAALDVPDAAVAGEYVSAVSETDGKISVERANVSEAVLNGYAKGTDATAIAASDSLKVALGKLENQVEKAKAAATTKVEKDASASHLTLGSEKAADGSVTYKIGEYDIASATELSAEIAARKAVDGQDGPTYAKNTSAHYISEATSLNDADIKLDAALQAEAERATAAEKAIEAKVDKIKYNVVGTALIVDGISLDSTLTL